MLKIIKNLTNVRKRIICKTMKNTDEISMEKVFSVESMLLNLH